MAIQIINEPLPTIISAYKLLQTARSVYTWKSGESGSFSFDTFFPYKRGIFTIRLPVN
jgi:hypothetical protein